MVLLLLLLLSSSSLLLPPVVLAWLLLALLGPPYSLLEMSPSAPLLPAMLVAESEVGLDSDDDAALEAETYLGGLLLAEESDEDSFPWWFDEEPESDPPLGSCC